MTDLYRKLMHVDILRSKLTDDDESAFRLYGGSRHGPDYGPSYLQIRGVLSRADGSAGKDFVLATAALGEDDLRALRAAIDERLPKEDETPTAEPPTLFDLAVVANALGLSALTQGLSAPHHLGAREQVSKALRLIEAAKDIIGKNNANVRA